MGCDIHSVAERRVNGKWEVIPGLRPFDWRHYGWFGFLANVRNYSAIPSLAQPRGVPVDSPFRKQAVELGTGPEYDAIYELGDHSYSWLSVEELLAFDYDAPVEDRRVTVGNNGGCTAEPGGGTMTTYREFLGTKFFIELDTLMKAGAERIVFGFDS